jgi:hypothetical protein
MENIEEKWVSILKSKSYYEVSSFGSVRSTERVVEDSLGRKRLRKSVVLKPLINHNGYLQVNLFIDCKNITSRISRLVAEAFIPNPENKLQVNHINGIKTDNRVENLEWNTSLENIRHSIVNNLKKTARGEQSGACKFKDEDIRYIRKSNKIKYHLAKEYNVHITTITNIINKITWKHI